MEANQGYLATLPLLAPKVEKEGDPAGWPSARTMPRHDLSAPALTPRALQVHNTACLSENLKTQYNAYAAGGAPTLKSVTRTPKNWEKTKCCRTLLKCSQPKKRVVMNVPPQILLSLPFIPRYFLSLDSYTLDACLASNSTRVIIWARVIWASFLCSIQPYTCHHLG